MAALSNFLTRRSFERRTRELVAPLYRAARALTGNETDAEDLVQDAYVKGFLAFREGEFTSMASCRAWLFRIMVNTFRDHYRRRARMPEMELVVVEEGLAGTDGEALATDVPGPDLLVEATFLRHAIAEAVLSLPPEVRIVVTLFFVEGMKYREIAEVAGCPIGTVMSRVARGRQLLQATLAAGWRGDADQVGPGIPKAGTRI
jgi:RNA polymerase sigma-70 factor (ECF subfamily)